jgi:diguanylate cyclase (GGDEF)-like protein
LGTAKEHQRWVSANNDLIGLGTATAAIFLFVATGGSVLPDVVDALVNGGNGPDQLLVNALLLNIAVVLFGWRRYRELMREIDEHKRAEEQARVLAEIDPLTGCLNRRSMSGATQRVRERASEAGQAVAFVMIDLDNFKQINDMHGHSTGDRVLVRLVELVRDHLPRNSVLARLGGDEFAFVTPYDPKFPERIDDIVIRLFERIGPSFDLGDQAIEITMSIGVASDANDGSHDPQVANVDDLMHRADTAMYHAKKQGKNRFFWFEPAMESELRFRNELETGIRRGLANGEFVPFYEQQIDLDTGELVGFEMLARWRSPHLGLVNPDIFIPIAEEIGVISALSEQLVARAFNDAAEWDEDLTLSINVSPVQLRDPWFAQKLLRALVEHRMSPHRLEVEITESCLTDNIGMVRSMITSLRNQGVQISLDDFGTGYSSLEQLRTLPFDRIKIDRRFVGELSDPAAAAPIVDAIVSLGRGLNLPITAEGIEDEQILRTLRAMGPLKGQGYLYGRPESAEEVRERLRAAGRLATSNPPRESEEPTLVVRESNFVSAARAAR